MTTATSEKVSATGGSGTKYSFHVYPIGTRFKPVGGVYMYLCGTKPIYVGQTGDLSTRFNDHHKQASIDRHLANRIAVIIVATEAERLRIERDLLDGYYWPCNG